MSNRKRYGVRSLRFKLVLASTLVEIVMLGLLVWNSTRIADQAISSEFERRAEILALLLNASIAPALAERDYATLDDVLEKIVQRETIVYIEVRDALNRSVSARGPVPANDMLDISVRLGGNVFDQALDVKIGGSMVGHMRFGVSVGLLNATVEQLRWQGLSIAALEVVLTFGLLTVLGYYLTRHLRMLSDGARNMQAGDYETYLPESGTDEVADTARAFNTMARAVEHSLQTLQKHQALFKDITDNSSAVIYVKDLDGRFQFVNHEFERLFGLSATQIIGKSNHDLLPKEVADAVRANDIAVIEKKAALHVEEMVPLADGPHDYLSVKFPLLDVTGQVYATAGISTDITQRKQAVEALKDSERFFRNVLDGLSMMAGTLTPQGVLLFANKAALNAGGLSSEQVLGKSLIDSYWIAWSEPVQQRLREAIQRAADGATVHYDEQVRMVGDHIIDVALVIVPVRDTQGRVTHLTMSGFDITERKRAAAEIHMLNTELEQRVNERTTQLAVANKELEAFAYSVSHDLRAPLRAIDGFSQALIADYAPRLDVTGQNYLMRVCAATQHMGLLIDDLLRLSRVSRQDMTRQGVDLSKLAQDIVLELTQREPQRVVDVVIAPGLHALGDARLLRLVLDNMFSNAWKYTSKKIGARIEFGVINRTDESVFFIRDDGAGFDMQYAAKLFGAFQRMHKAEDFPGTGVGLATAARIIHRHGGRIWAEAEVDKGAVFYFTLPTGENGT